MRKRSPPSNKREALEAQRRARWRRLWAMGAAALALVAIVGVIIYLAVRDEGPPRVTEVGDQLSVYYTLWLEDGTQVESNVGSTPFKFVLGAGRVIKGWDEGLVGMKVGEKRTLTIPPDKAYGSQGSPPKIPPNATLTFEVQLAGIE